MSDVIEFRPKVRGRKPIDLDAAVAETVKAVLATKPTTVVILAADMEDPQGRFMVFTGGKRTSEVNWLLDLAKQALLTGELSED